jgi:Pentapeptide repeats (8 copies)
MCQFFSCVSDGKGNVKFFKPEDIVKIMGEGNPESYDWNSHTSLMSWLGIKAKDEEKWTKWEYNPESKELKLDKGTLADDKNKIKKVLDKYFDDKDILFLRNLYGRNSGDGNSGDGNSGDRNSGNGNSGNGNSGHRNSGHRNSGHWNSGHWNSGDWNSGNGNSGNRNSGDWNSGNWNSGNWNSGDWNSGDGNSGHWNSGNGNSGDWNSGDWNSGDGALNGFCTEQTFLLFDKPCTKEEYEKINQLDWSWFWINKWINESEMTDDEKKQNPTYKTTGGYLKKIEYKEAFKACPQSFIDQVKKLAHYDAAKFEIISGLKV